MHARLIPTLLLIATLLIPAVSMADDDPKKQVRERLSQAIPGLTIQGVRESDVPGLYEVVTQGQETLYATPDGRHFVVGKLYRLDENGLTNLTEKGLSKKRARLLSQVDDARMISFAPDGPVKATVNVFTDIDCPYCRKLHQEVPRLNEQGVRVNYLAYPRSGPGTPSFRKYVSVWCSEDRQTAMDQAKAGQSVPSAQCDNPVQAQFRLGGQVGVTGTPAIILEDGRMIRGYVPAERLLQALESS
ncbi:thiol:disulfide interchange protein DsbC [Tamilnaduibacter salinus]|uniref:Thiol:disulfide interchange protein n=2 Tax=Tamilnaduibacter salinus TaxID=1484056 RepID=A0A2A2I850_9GAMM|nr:DsbC family protein [Tamilnaduibacter salinus]PAV27295.1 protein-disulfide isomerase [Tamilnaduibacter salinus]PVY78963.1 thiol:disulfide interchange protein DsbC [Tamilnaduibacter salinus]